MDASVSFELLLVKRSINAKHGGHREVLYLLYVFCHVVIEASHLRQLFILSLTPPRLEAYLLR